MVKFGPLARSTPQTIAGRQAGLCRNPRLAKMLLFKQFLLILSVYLIYTGFIVLAMANSFQKPIYHDCLIYGEMEIPWPMGVFLKPFVEIPQPMTE